MSLCTRVDRLYRFRKATDGKIECLNVALQHVLEYQHFKDAITMCQTHAGDPLEGALF